MNFNEQIERDILNEPKPDPSMILSWYLQQREDLYKQATLAIIMGQGYNLGPLIDTSRRMAHILERANMALPPPRDMLRRPAYAAACLAVCEDPELMIAYQDAPTEA